MNNYKFTQPVSMHVNQEQFDYLKPKLEAMGYEPDFVDKIKGEYAYIATNAFSNHNAYVNIDDGYNANSRHFIDHYNPDLFLAISAMTDAEFGIAGEHWVYKGATNRDFKDGRIYAAVKDISLKEAFIGNEGKLAGNAPFNKRDFRRATLPELITHYTKNKTDMSTDTRNVQISLEQAKALYEGNKEQYGWLLTTFPELEQPKAVSWGGVGKIQGYYANQFSIITSIQAQASNYSKNIYRTKAQAHGGLAQAMITQLLPVYNGDWVADWEKGGRTKFCIVLVDSKWNIKHVDCECVTILTFKEKATAERFLTEQSELLEQYKGLFIEPKNV